MRKFILSILILSIIFLTCSGLCSSAAAQSRWAVNEIELAFESGLITNNTAKNLASRITREQFCELVVKLYEKLSGTTANANGSAFKDTDNPEITKAYNLGIVSGVSPEEFAPRAFITRQEICVMIVRTIDKSIIGADLNNYRVNHFVDGNKVSPWASAAVNYAFDHGFIIGVAANTIAPLDYCTCEQAIIIIYRVFESCISETSINNESDSAFISQRYNTVNEGNASGIFSLGKHNWYYATSSGERDIYIEGVFSAMFQEFARIFGYDTMTHKLIMVYNSTEAAYPMTAPYNELILIRLSQEKTSYWAQMIFQLSHEMTHYAYFSFFPEANQDNFESLGKTRWNEEIVCEAMALYMLKYMSENWCSCVLSSINTSFDASIRRYLENEYSKADTSAYPLKSVGDTITINEFHRRFNETASERYEHATERNYLFNLFVSVDSSTIGEILSMYRYFNSEFNCIDYDLWIANATNTDFIEKVSAIQPRFR